MILDDIIDNKKIEVLARKRETPFRNLEKKIKENNSTRGFLKKAGSIQLIAELKKASPSRGTIREDFDPVPLAQICVKEGAAALSVLTEEKFFLGRLDYITEVKKVTNVPLLRKDFIIDEYQILESRAYGADAVLLIASLLKPKILQKYLEFARDFGLEALVEVHSEEELDFENNIIGINNRDLKTFKVDIKNTERIIKKIKKDAFIVSESGIHTREDVLYLQGLGVSAMLVGGSIMASKDPGAKIRELLGT